MFPSAHVQLLGDPLQRSLPRILSAAVSALQHLAVKFPIV